MKKTPLVLFVTSILLAGCGSGDSSPNGNASNSGTGGHVNGNSGSAPAAFSDTIIPTGFDWSMENSEVINLKHVSTISQASGIPLDYAGEFYIEVYSIDENNDTSADPILKAMTNREGEAKVLLTLLNSWKGITVKTKIEDSVCINTVYKEQITTTLALGCDVVLDSDLL
ncbi:hypothetical protein HWV00_07485 [Moritella sp. 24]|uniref:hypothetical protein n=1 Tax=Moritella sp. 24 TaxID=2746230 RepID=UPI001BA689E6|nr:hypothetical protein [Moritella sp. 24]QUM76074.1 hypothetical protein HWV00_07485 [Moritella sp. 24]